ncbi:MAG: energy-coupling factor transporter transmembrane protein EcfT [Lachnospiraceae bacterium]|nr:energy-coupling factor transporter transmembrane protein EcfT [Lachnospiraceae bacterium]
MLRDITIGQYYQTGSVIHKLDPRVKLAATILYVISLFPFSTLPVYAIATVFLVMAVCVSKVPIRHIIKGLKTVMILVVMTGIMNIFLTKGENVLVDIYGVKITQAGLERAFYMVIRLIYLIIGSSLLTYTTTPNELTDAIEKSLKPLNKIKVPVHEFSIMISLALRFIPILVEEADKIIKAQSSRGADFEEGSFFVKIKNMVSIIVPLLISAIRRADDLALAMDSRCYNGGGGRTKLHPLKYKKKDVIGYVTVIVYFALVIIVGLML